MNEFVSDDLEELLAAVGDLLALDGEEVGIVVVGGATLNIRGFVERVTKDVDVIALVDTYGDSWRLVPPDPLPASLVTAVGTVARDFDVSSDWLNTVIGAQWSQGLPDSLPDDIEWRRYGGLHVGFTGRAALIALKLFASVDQTAASVHYQDLVALAPTEEELVSASEWVAGQDASAVFPELLAEILERLRDDLR